MEKKPPTIRDLYPDLNDEQLAEVEDSLEQYLALILRIFERVEAEGGGQLTSDSGAIACRLQEYNHH